LQQKISATEKKICRFKKRAGNYHTQGGPAQTEVNQTKSMGAYGETLVERRTNKPATAASVDKERGKSNIKKSFYQGTQRKDKGLMKGVVVEQRGRTRWLTGLRSKKKGTKCKPSKKT